MRNHVRRQAAFRQAEQVYGRGADVGPTFDAPINCGDSGSSIPGSNFCGRAAGAVDV